MFVYSLPLIFAFTNLLTPRYFYFLLVIIFGVIFFSIPKVNSNWTDHIERNFYLTLKSCWEGNVSLWRAFWPFFLIANAAFFYIDYRVENITYTISNWRTVHVILFFPGIWWIRSVWKCSSNSRKKIWPIFARSLAIYFVIDYGLRLLTSYQYPEVFFDCRLLLMDIGNCY